MRRDIRDVDSWIKETVRLVIQYWKSGTVVDLDNFVRHVGPTSIQYRVVGDLHPQPPEVAINLEVGHTMGNANDRQVDGQHYQKAAGKCPHCQGVIQHWDLYGDQPYLVGQVTRYVTREKHGLLDLEKAGHVLQKLIEYRFPGTKVTFEVAQKADTASGAMGRVHRKR